jgi:hypothetical protein
MVGFLLFVLIVVLIVRWAMLSRRYSEMEERIAMVIREHIEPKEITKLIKRITQLEATVAELKRGRAAEVEAPPAPVVVPEPAPRPAAIPVVAPEPKSEPPKPSAPPAGPHVPVAPPVYVAPEPVRPSRTSAEWEALVGGNWTTNWRGRPGHFHGAVSGLRVSAIRAGRHLGDFAGAQFHAARGRRVARAARALRDLRTRTAGRRMGGALFHHLRDASPGRGEGDSQSRSGRAAAAGGSGGHGGPFAAIPRAGGHRLRLFHGVPHAGDHAAHRALGDRADSAGGVVAVHRLPLRMGGDGAVRVGGHLRHLRHEAR